MKSYIISGGNPLFGEIDISGSKNSAVAILIATLIADEPITLFGIPDITDVTDCITILRLLGCSVELLERNTLKIDPRNAEITDIPAEISSKMRASSYLMGAMLSRFGRCGGLSMGGCDFGSRPINYHLLALEKLGARLETSENTIILSAPDGLKGAHITFPRPTVGGTVNAIIASVKAKGVTVIDGAAKEPHVCDLCEFLNLCGADISGFGGDRIQVNGVQRLHGTSFRIRPDMIEAGTYLSMALATGGRIRCSNAPVSDLDAVFEALKRMGASLEITESSVKAYTESLKRTQLRTAPYPEFPTDLHPLFTVLLSRAKGVSFIDESIFEHRFRYLDGLSLFGVDTELKDGILLINGGTPLSPALASCTDLRGGAALVSTALCAEGQSYISNVHYVQRGYEDMPKKLRILGAEIEECE